MLGWWDKKGNSMETGTGHQQNSTDSGIAYCLDVQIS